jgi:hypothetical protein
MARSGGLWLWQVELETKGLLSSIFNTRQAHKVALGALESISRNYPEMVEGCKGWLLEAVHRADQRDRGEALEILRWATG